MINALHMADMCMTRWSPDGTRGFELNREVAKLVVANIDGREVGKEEWAALAKRLHPEGDSPRSCAGFQSQFDAAVWAISQTASDPMGLRGLRGLIAEPKQ